ncbi:pentatricopeptide repeat-containing protein At1g19720 [Quercus suber]|uniref:pentatricopeptide repeat-containing protein At1g19720 n=1 Tax=Quercus suber TaxID=58331 RepID=UPI0032DEFD6C
MENLVILCNASPPLPIPSKLANQSKFSTKPTISFSVKTHTKLTDAHLNSLSKNGRLSEAITALDSIAQSGSKVNSNTYINLLQSCIDLNSIQLGRELHARINLVNDVNPYVETKIVSMYAKCGSLDDARKVFDEMGERNLYTWSAMIGACSRGKRWREAVELFFLMMGNGVVPDSFLFPKVLQACANCGDFETGKLIHSLVVRLGMSCYSFVNNSILAVYVKSGKLSLARKFFENMDERDSVTWNAIISGYCQKGEIDEALRLFDAMLEEGVEPGSVTWNILITSYNQLGQCDVAKELMKKMESFGITPDVFTWTSMISGYAQNNKNNRALDLFKDMLQEGVKPNGVTITNAISACSTLKSLDKGLEIHSVAVKMGLINDLLVGNSLTDMYSKCGELEAAWKVFDMVLEKDVYTWNSMIGGYCQAGYYGKAHQLLMKMQESGVSPNVVTWNMMISGYMQNGDEDQAMDLFQKMENDGKTKRDTASWNALIAGYLQTGQKDKALGIFRQMQSSYVIPNSVTILSVLPACANLIAGKKVKEIHGCVFRRSLETELPIANSLIDTYAKSGNIIYSRTIFDGLASKDIITWNSLIGGYVLHGHADTALDLFDQMKKFGVRPNRGTFANIIVEGEKKPITVGPWGGQHGLCWDDGVYSSVRQLVIAHGVGIDSIQIEYDNKGTSIWSEKHGGNGSNKIDRVKLDCPDEFLTSIHGHYGCLNEWGPVFVRSLSFESNRKTYGPFGTEQGTYFSFPMAGGKIVGFHGKSGWYLDAIGAYLKPVEKQYSSNVMLKSQSYVANGTEKVGYSVIQGSVGENFDIVLAVRQKDEYGNPLQKKTRGFSTTEYNEVEIKERVPSIEKVPSRVDGAVTYGPWGGTGGSTFDDGTYTGIRQINLSRNVGIVWIRALYDCDGDAIWGNRHGGSGGFKNEKIIFDFPSEVLTHIVGSYGPLMYMGPSVIRSLTFYTNKGKYGPFGEEQGTSFATKLKEGKIVGIHGRKGLFLDALGVHVIEGKIMPLNHCTSNAIIPYEPAVSELDNPHWSNKLALARQVPSEEVAFGVVKEPAPCGPGPWGGDGGRPWDDGVFSGIKQIYLTRVAEAICSVQIEYDRNGQAVWSIKHGGNGGTATHRIKLEHPHEVLICISGYYGSVSRDERHKVIKSLTFYTSRGKYGPFGEEIGTFFTSTTTEGKVVGFHGRSSSYLDAIGIHMQHWLGNQRTAKSSIFRKFT